MLGPPIPLTALVFLLVASCAGISPEVAEPDVQEPTATSPPFEPPEPQPDDFDWIKLDSGEWLKGEFLRVRDGKLEFDSDELDELSFDLDDVVEVRAPRMCTVLIEGRKSREGTLHIKEGEVVLGGAETVVLRRSQVVAIIPGQPSEANYWSGKLSLGLTGRRGNTSQTDFSAYGFTRRATAGSRWDSTYSGAFGRTKGIETTNNHRLSSRLDFFLSRRLFVTPVSVTASRDPFSNIDLRLTPSAGFGYDLLDQNTVSWEIGGGPAYQYTIHSSVGGGEKSTEDSLAGLFSTTVDWDITPDIETKLDYNITVPMPGTDEYNHHLALILSLDLIGSFDLDVTFAWDRVNKPKADEHGVVPSPDDLRLSVGLGWDF